MQRNPHSYQIATGYRTFYSLSLIYQPITKKRLFFRKKISEIILDPYVLGYINNSGTYVYFLPDSNSGLHHL